MMRLLVTYLALMFAAPAFSQREDSVRTVVDVPAEFPGGNRKLLNWISENAEVPSSAYVEPGCVKVHLTFIVEADGSITGLQKMRTDSPEFDAYILSLFAKMPSWTPALVDEKPVRSAVSLPVRIRLDN